jgi:hypothetical protein
MSLFHKILAKHLVVNKLGLGAIALSLSSVVLIGCAPNEPATVQKQEAQHKAAMDSATKGTAETKVTSAAVAEAKLRIAESHGKSTEAETAALEESLRNSYARLAAKHNDVCPKLLQKEVDSSEIVRSNDVMFDKHCDYFIYPQPGQHILVTSNNALLEALLISPEMYSFKNGDYIAKSSRKHVIRITYNGIAHQPKPVSYDVVVTIED